MNYFYIMAQQAYRQIQGVRQVANRTLSQAQQTRQLISCQGPQSNNVVDTPTNGLPFPIELAIETTQREIQESLGNLPWGSIDKEEIHRLLTARSYEFEVSANTVLIKNQAANLEEVKYHLENKVTDSNCVFCCELKEDGDIEVTRKYISPISLKYLKIGHDVVEGSVVLAKIKQDEILKPGYFLNDPKNIKLLFDNAEHILTQFPTGRIFGLGQSPAWILEAAKNLDPNPSRISSVAFSGRIYNEKLFLDNDISYEKNLNQYCNYLKSIGLSPKAIVENPIVLVELTHSGAGLKSFLSVLNGYAIREGVSISELDNSIHVHIVVGKDCAAHLPKTDPKSLNVKSVQFTSQKFCIDMGNSDSYEDRLVPHYNHEEWSTYPDQSTLNQNNINAIRQKLSDVASNI